MPHPNVVAERSSAGFLRLLLSHVMAVMPVPGQVTAAPALALMIGSGPRVGAQDLQAPTGISQCVAA